MFNSLVWSMPGAVPGTEVAPPPLDPRRAVPGPSLTGHQLPQHQPCRGLAPAARATAAPMSYTSLSRKSTRVPVYWEGWTRHRPARGVPIWGPSCGLLQQPLSEPSTVSICRAGTAAVARAWQCLGPVALMLPWLRGWGGRLGHPVAGPQQHHTTHSCHCGQNLGWTTAPRAAAAFCYGQPWPAPSPCVHRHWEGGGSPIPEEGEWL